MTALASGRQDLRAIRRKLPAPFSQVETAEGSPALVAYGQDSSYISGLSRWNAGSNAAQNLMSFNSYNVPTKKQSMQPITGWGLQHLRPRFCTTYPTKVAHGPCCMLPTLATVGFWSSVLVRREFSSKPLSNGIGSTALCS